MTKRNIALCTAAVLALGLFWLVVPAQDYTPPHDPDAMIGKPLAALQLPALNDDAPAFQSSALKGHVTVINIFASWCAACRSEHPLLKALAAQPVTMVGIAYKDKAAAARRALNEGGNPYAVVARDEAGRARSVLGLDGVPETYLIDKDGIIRFRQAGPLTEAVIKGELLPLIARLNRAAYPSATTAR